MLILTVSLSWQKLVGRKMDFNPLYKLTASNIVGLPTWAHMCRFINAFDVVRSLEREEIHGGFLAVHEHIAYMRIEWVLNGLVDRELWRSHWKMSIEIWFSICSHFKNDPKLAKIDWQKNGF